VVTKEANSEVAVVKFTTVKVTKLPLWHKMCKIGMICSAKSVPTENFSVVQKQEFFSNMLYVRNVHLTKGQAYLQERKPSSRQRGCYKRTITERVQMGKRIPGRVFQGA
jgi:hypothetical protein